MITKGIRGAITVESNTVQALEDSTLELVDELFKQNGIDKNSLSHVIFTLTDDLNAAFPAKFVRQKLDWSEVAMMCFHELDVPDSLKMCLRILLVVNCKDDFKPQFVYLKGAKALRG